MKFLKQDRLILLFMVLLNLLFQLVKVPNSIGVLVFGFTFYFIWYYFIKYGLKSLGFASFRQVNNKKEFIGFGLFGLVMLMSFFYKENFIHFWDSAGYWKMIISYSEYFFSDYQGGVETLYWSLERDEYTLLPVVYLLLPLKLFGYDYVWFVVSIYLIFILPFFFLCFAFFQKLDVENIVPLYLRLLLIFSFSFFIVPLFNGFVGSMGLTLVMVILFSSFYKLKEKIDWEDVLVLTLSFVFLMFTRRWYLFWIVSFVLSFLLSHLVYDLLDKKRFTLYRWKRISFKFIPVGVLGTVFMFLLFRRFLKRVFFNEFHDIYSAYQSSSIFDDFRSFYEYSGVFVLLFMVLGVITCFRKRNLISIFFLLQLMICFFLFIKMNRFGNQHYYLLSVGVFYFFIHGIRMVISKGNIGASVLIVGLLSLSYYLTFINKNSSYFGFSKSFFTHEDANPNIRNDIPELRRLVKELNAIDDGKIYTLASSIVINDDIIKNINVPKEFNAVPNMTWVRHVDKRDGFPSEFLQVKYLLIADPIQTHLAPSDQQIVEYPAQEVLHGSFSHKFKLESEFQLDKGVKLKLFRKIEAFDLKDIKQIQNHFKERYPNYPNLYDFWYEGKN